MKTLASRLAFCMRFVDLVRRTILCLALCSSAAFELAAQDTTSTPNLRPTPEGRVVQLVLRDGSSLLGRVLEVTPVIIRFASSFGETSVPRSAVASVRLIDPSSIHDGELWPEDPSRTRLLFAPTGRMLRTGETYLTDAYIFFPSVQSGVSDVFSIGAGVSIFPGVAVDEQILYLTPKLGVYASPNVNVAIGALVAGGKVLSDVAPVGIGYGVATFGDDNSSLTTGAGFGFTRGTTSSTALLLAGGTTRVSKNFALVTENYLTTGRDATGIFSGGVRFIGERISVDLAAWGGSGVDTIVPYVAFIYRF